MITREIFSVLRGSDSPMQLLLAAWIGALIGFIPGSFDHLGLLTFYACLLLVLNANIGVALGLVGVGKLASLLLMPVSFSLGRFLIDGPLSGVMQAAFDTPVVALLDLEYYAVTGGIVLGSVVGLLGGWLISRTLGIWRTRFAKLEADSDRYNKTISKRSTRFFIWLFFGEREREKTVRYQDLLEERFGSPIRWPGVALVAVFAGLCLFAPDLVSGPLLGAMARDGLESANGATVDLSAASLDTRQGTLAFDGLALADANQLSADLFRATRLEADGDMADLLRGRLAIDRLVIVDGANGEPRATPGVLLEDERDEPSGGGEGGGGGGGGAEGDGTILDEYIKEGQVWQERFEQLQDWLETLGGGPSDGPPDETLEERLEREIAELGYAGVRASHLLSDAPLLVVREIVAEGVTSTSLPGELFDIHIANLSTAPDAVPGAPRLIVRSRSGAFDMDVALGGRTRPPEDNVLRFSWKGLSTDAVAAQLSDSLAERLAGGTLDLSIDGRWKDNVIGALDLPLLVDMHDVQLDVGGRKRSFAQLALPIELSGSLTDLHVSVDDAALQEALVGGLETELRGEVDRRKAEAEAELRAAAQEKLQEQLGTLDPDADAKEQAEQLLKEKAAKKVGGLLGGLLGGDEDDG